MKVKRVFRVQLQRKSSNQEVLVEMGGFELSWWEVRGIES